MADVKFKYIGVVVDEIGHRAKLHSPDRTGHHASHSPRIAFARSEAVGQSRRHVVDPDVEIFLSAVVESAKTQAVHLLSLELRGHLFLEVAPAEDHRSFNSAFIANGVTLRERLREAFPGSDALGQKLVV